MARKRYPLPAGEFTIRGYNDRPKPCSKKGCKGKVHPTFNANVGQCDRCKERVAWAYYRRHRSGRRTAP